VDCSAVEAFSEEDTITRWKKTRSLGGPGEGGHGGSGGGGAT